MCALGFEQCPSEHAVYRRGSGTSLLIVGVYVDDLVITGADTAEIISFKQQMIGMFRMSDLGMLSYYLGIEVSKSAAASCLGRRPMPSDSWKARAWRTATPATPRWRLGSS